MVFCRHFGPAWLRPWPVKILFLALCAYVIAFAIVLVTQERFVYRPPHEYTSPEDAKMRPLFNEIWVNDPDEYAHYAWYIGPSTRKGVIIFMHGNADSINSVASRLTPFVDAGYGVMIPEYSGYGTNQGSPSEETLYTDVQNVINFLHAIKIKDEQIILMGHSLGAAVATEIAVRHKMAGTILIAPFLSIADMGQLRFPFFPLRPFVKDKFDNAAKIARVQSPLLIFTAAQDRTVPPSHGEKLFNLAQDPKGLHEIKGADHNNMFNDDFYGVTLNWLESLPMNVEQAAPPGARESVIIQDKGETLDYVPVDAPPAPLPAQADPALTAPEPTQNPSDP